MTTNLTAVLWHWHISHDAHTTRAFQSVFPVPAPDVESAVQTGIWFSDLQDDGRSIMGLKSDSREMSIGVCRWPWLHRARAHWFLHYTTVRLAIPSSCLVGTWVGTRMRENGPSRIKVRSVWLLPRGRSVERGKFTGWISQIIGGAPFRQGFLQMSCFSWVPPDNPSVAGCMHTKRRLGNATDPHRALGGHKG